MGGAGNEVDVDETRRSAVIGCILAIATCYGVIAAAANKVIVTIAAKQGICERAASDITAKRAFDNYGCGTIGKGVRRAIVACQRSTLISQDEPFVC